MRVSNFKIDVFPVNIQLILLERGEEQKCFNKIKNFFKDTDVDYGDITMFTTCLGMCFYNGFNQLIWIMLDKKDTILNEEILLHEVRHSVDAIENIFNISDSETKSMLIECIWRNMREDREYIHNKKKLKKKNIKK